MKRPFIASLAVSLLACCSFADQITDHSLDYNTALEEHDNSQLVINILRAKDNVPISFSDLSQIRGSIQTTGSLLSVWPFGQLRATTTRASEQPTVSIQLNPTFDIAPLNTTLFTEAVLKPVDVNFISQLQASHYIPDRVLLNLFIDTIEENVGNGQKKRFVNTPCLPSSDNIQDCLVKYQTFLNELNAITSYPSGSPNEINTSLNYRIVFHKYSERKPVSLPNATMAIKDVPSVAGVTVKVVNGKAQAFQVTEKVAVCRETDQVLPNNQLLVLKIEPLEGDQNCGVDDGDAPTTPPTPGKYKFTFRSLRGMFDYLGELLFLQPKERPLYFDISETAYPNNWLKVTYKDKLFYVADIDPKTRTLPKYTDDTAHVFQILTELLNTSRNAQEIPTTKAVQQVP